MSRKVLDFGAQAILNGRVCLLVTPASIKFLSFLNSAKGRADIICLARLETGFGGVEIPGSDVLKVIVYPGNYTYQMKRSRPRKLVQPACSQNGATPDAPHCLLLLVLEDVDFPKTKMRGFTLASKKVPQ